MDSRHIMRSEKVSTSEEEATPKKFPDSDTAFLGADCSEDTLSSAKDKTRSSRDWRPHKIHMTSSSHSVPPVGESTSSAEESSFVQSNHRN